MNAALEKKLNPPEWPQSFEDDGAAYMFDGPSGYVRVVIISFSLSHSETVVAYMVATIVNRLTTPISECLGFPRLFLFEILSSRSLSCPFVFKLLL